MPDFDMTTALSESRALADLTHLNRLDDLWTFYLHELPAKADAEQLEEITSEMHDLLERIGEHAGRLQDIIEEQGPDFDQAFEKVLSMTTLSGDQRRNIKHLVEHNGGFAQLAIDQLDVLQTQNVEESQQLQSQMQDIHEFGYAHGDLRFSFKCALFFGLLAASIAALVTAGVMVIPAVAQAIAAGAGGQAIVAQLIQLHGVPGGLLLESIHTTATLHHLIEKGCFQ
ncbi:hypothetical protein SAMN05216332_11612 [Nitrosospira briensis]|nr:hypothetical protein SAMN05216332_11612 [Nitrosospira briensis]